MNNKKYRHLLSGPYIFWSVAFIIIPLCMVFYYGLTDKTGAFTLANVAAISSAEHSKALWLSIALSLISTLICFLLAYPLAMILANMNVNQHSFIVLIFILPMWMNFLLRTLAWQTLLEKTGVINSILAFLHLPSLNIINTPAAIVLGMVYNFLPFMVLPIYNVLVKIDPNVVNGKGFRRQRPADLPARHLSFKPSRRNQRHYHGFCPCPDNLRHQQPAGRQQDPPHRQCH